VSLTPKAFDLLLALVERQGRLAEKDELLKLVWPDTFVEEANLSYNISLIRKALGDGENGQKYIETVPKRGYRFVAQVSVVREKSEELAAAEPVNSQADIAAVPETNAQTTPYRQPAAGGSKLIRSASRRLAAAALGVLLTAAAVISFTRRSEDRGVQIKSLAVLPFKPLATNSRDEALELGMADTLIAKLSSLRQIIVRPTSAVRKYTALDQDPLAAGREQQVDAVLESSMSLLGEKIRVTVRLLDVRDGRTLWAYQCTEYCTDIFAAQDAISQKVAEALALELTGEERKGLAEHYTNSVEAWMLYVRGRQLVHKRQIPDLEKAITYFERAIALDQEFALAQVMLGFAYASLNFLGNSPAKEVMPKAKAAYDWALKLDDQLAEAHAYLAQYKQFYEWDYIGAEQLHRRAIDLNPNSADVHHRYAMHLSYLGRSELAILEIRKAEELDPTDLFIVRNVAQVLYLARHYDQAIEQSERAAELYPNSAVAYNWMTRAYEMKGDEQAAFAAYVKQAKASGAGMDEIAGMKAAFPAGGLKAYWRSQLDRQLEQEKSGYVRQFQVALLYARLGVKEQSLARLERAAEERDFYVTALNVEPLWDSYRTDPRFVALVRRVGLSP
jgi:DNA-binding winged helix-turn-helix (wHTH) protein/TolB-like protein